MDHKIRIGNLPETASKYELEDLLTMVADVQSLRLESTEEGGRVAMVAFAHMASEQDVKNCVDRFNGSSFRGRVLNVRDDKPFVPRVSIAKSKTAKPKRRRTAGKA